MDLDNEPDDLTDDKALGAFADVLMNVELTESDMMDVLGDALGVCVDLRMQPGESIWVQTGAIGETGNVTLIRPAKSGVTEMRICSLRSWNDERAVGVCNHRYHIAEVGSYVRAHVRAARWAEAHGVVPAGCDAFMEAFHATPLIKRRRAR